MKNANLKYYLAGWIAVWILSFSSCTCNRQTPEQKDPANYVYYLGQSPGAHLGNAREAAARLLGNDLKGEFISNTGDGNIYYTDKNDPTTRFQQDPKTGNFSFSKSLTDYLGDSKPKLPAITEAAAIARDDLKTYQLLPADEKQLQTTHVGGVKSAAVINGNQRGEEIDKMRTVVFTREIDSTAVVGPGSKIVVQLGNNNALLGMAYRWKNINQDKKKTFIPPAGQISPEEAQAEVKQRIVRDFGEQAKISIISSKKILYDGNGAILQPVYAFEVAISARIGKEQEGHYQYLYLIQAMKQSPEPVNIANIPPEAKRLIDTVRINENQKPSDTAGKD